MESEDTEGHHLQRRITVVRICSEVGVALERTQSIQDPSDGPVAAADDDPDVRNLPEHLQPRGRPAFAQVVHLSEKPHWLLDCTSISGLYWML